MGKAKRKWQEHLDAAQASGLGLAGYAAKHGLNVRHLYDTRHADLKAKAARERKASSFVRVKVKPQSSVGVGPNEHLLCAVGTLAIQARLGNGVILSWTHDESGAAVLAELMHTLASLPCFG